MDYSIRFQEDRFREIFMSKKFASLSMTAKKKLKLYYQELFQNFT